jgi:hypothetical protein
VACVDRPFPFGKDVALESEAERLGRELLTSQADSVRAVITRYPELHSSFGSTSQDDVKMRISGIEMLDADPFEANT